MLLSSKTPDFALSEYLRCTDSERHRSNSTDVQRKATEASVSSAEQGHHSLQDIWEHHLPLWHQSCIELFMCHLKSQSHPLQTRTRFCCKHVNDSATHGKTVSGVYVLPIFDSSKRIKTKNCHRTGIFRLSLLTSGALHPYQCSLYSKIKKERRKYCNLLLK